MFTDFFLLLRHRGIAVSPSEWMTLMEALSLGLAHESLTSFYFLSRSLCVKSEALFDLFDQTFNEYFKGVAFSERLQDEIFDWLDNPKEMHHLSPEERQHIRQLDLDELRKEFEKRLTEQNERHDGGNHWIGTGGTSPFGHSGYHPDGVRVGGQSRHRSASQLASQRRFANLRHDRILDTRQIGLALKKLRQWEMAGPADQLDIEQTIDRTCRNAGEIELVVKRNRKSMVKLILIMDVGGSMTPHASVCERLFSAAFAAKHFKALKYYYFHNCPYDFLYEDISQNERIPTTEVFREHDSSWFVLMIGDAAMHPWELTMPGGNIDYFQHNETPGIKWLDSIRQHFPKSAWINPEMPSQWQIPSTQIVQKIFPNMFAMTLEGLEQAVHNLLEQSR